MMGHYWNMFIALVTANLLDIVFSMYNSRTAPRHEKNIIAIKIGANSFMRKNA